MKLGVIGCGNMGSAIVKGILKKGIFAPGDMILTDKNNELLNSLKEELKTETEAENADVAKKADVILLAVKPQFVDSVLADIKDSLDDKKLILSIVAGKSVAYLTERLGDVKIVRAMPNTPALVLCGATGVTFSEKVTDDDKKIAMDIFESFSVVKEVPENLMNTVTGLSGSSPAYVFMFIEAMADAAVADGMPRDAAYEMAAATVMGSAKLMLETGKHPGELKDMVCSPGGTTIEAVRVLEEKGFRSAVIECMKACVKKAGEL